MTGPLFCGWVGGIGKVGDTKNRWTLVQRHLSLNFVRVVLITQQQCYQQQQQSQQQ